MNMSLKEKRSYCKRNTTTEESYPLSPLSNDYPEVSMAPLTRTRVRCTSVGFEQDKDSMTVWINSLTSQEVLVNYDNYVTQLLTDKSSVSVVVLSSLYFC